MGDSGSQVMGSVSLRELQAQLAERSRAMKTHSVFGAVHGVEDLRTFMAWHVFAVLDFMSLVKRLQQEFTCVSLPWTPPTHPEAARLLNEIVLGEESDSTPWGNHVSHFDLYLAAMKEVQAETGTISRFVQLLKKGVSVDVALEMVGAPAAVARFFKATIATATTGSVAGVLGSFLYGREDAIPQMFKTLLAQWSVPPADTPTFVWYLQRHIEVDGESHGPAANRLADEVTQGNEQELRTLYTAGLQAVEQRIALWDALQAELQTRHHSPTL